MAGNIIASSPALMRKLCLHCRHPTSRTRRRAASRMDEATTAVYQPVGCPSAKTQGYKGASRSWRSSTRLEIERTDRAPRHGRESAPRPRPGFAPRRRRDLRAHGQTARGDSRWSTHRPRHLGWPWRSCLPRVDEQGKVSSAASTPPTRSTELRLRLGSTHHVRVVKKSSARSRRVTRPSSSPLLHLSQLLKAGVNIIEALTDSGTPWTTRFARCRASSRTSRGLRLSEGWRTTHTSSTACSCARARGRAERAAERGLGRLARTSSAGRDASQAQRALIYPASCWWSSWG